MHYMEQTTVQIINVKDMGEDVSQADSPYECIAHVLEGDLDSAIQCASRHLGAYAKLNPLFNVTKLSVNSFSFESFQSVEVGERFTCSNDPEFEEAQHIAKNVELHRREALAYQLCVAISPPIDYSPYSSLLTFESFEHNITDAVGQPIQRYALCTLIEPTDTSHVFRITDINIEDRTVALDALSRDPYALYSLTVRKATDITLCAVPMGDQRVFEILKTLRPVFKGLGECHQLDLVNYIKSLISEEKHTILQVAEELVQRMMTLVGVEKHTVDCGIRYLPMSQSTLNNCLAKAAALDANITELSTLGLPENPQWSQAKVHYGLLIAANERLQGRSDHLIGE